MNALYVPIVLYDVASSCYRRALFDDYIELDCYSCLILALYTLYFVNWWESLGNNQEFEKTT